MLIPTACPLSHVMEDDFSLGLKIALTFGSELSQDSLISTARLHCSLVPENRTKHSTLRQNLISTNVAHCNRHKHWTEISVKSDPGAPRSKDVVFPV